MKIVSSAFYIKLLKKGDIEDTPVSVCVKFNYCNEEVTRKIC